MASLSTTTSPLSGFGRRIAWSDNTIVPPGHDMSFKESLNIISSDVVLKLLVPSWAMGLTPRLRRVRAAFDEIEVCCSGFESCFLLKPFKPEIHV
jgi:hypothetical protein